jgi:hypothetical protein
MAMLDRKILLLLQETHRKRIVLFYQFSRCTTLPRPPKKQRSENIETKKENRRKKHTTPAVLVGSNLHVKICCCMSAPAHLVQEEGAIGAVIGWTQAGFLIAGFFACIYLLVTIARELVRLRGSGSDGKLLWPRWAPLKIVYPLCAIYTCAPPLFTTSPFIVYPLCAIYKCATPPLLPLTL